MSAHIGYKPGEREQARERAHRSPKGADRWYAARKPDKPEAYVKRDSRYDPQPLICECERETVVVEGRCLKCGKATREAAAWDESRRGARKRRAGQA